MSSLPLLFETKVCVGCEVHQPLNAFPRNARGGGYQLKCRTCQPRYRQGGKPERAAKRLWQRANKEKRIAHKAVEWAIERGELTKKPCEYCGTTEKIHAHHDNYARLLNVMWLCAKHHYQRHTEIGRPIGRTRKAA